MTSGPRPFQVVLFGGFALLFFLAIFLFATFSGDSGSRAQYGSVTIWGTLDQSIVSSHIRQLGRDIDTMPSVTYRQVDERRFDTELVNAIAEGQQPDMILVSHKKLVQRRSMLFPINYDLISQRQFSDTYIDGFDIFARPDGIYAMPLAVDPLIMYWNRDIYASNGFAQPPTTWETIVNSVVPTIVRRTTDRRIQMSPVALGEYRNNRNAFSILSALMLQSGSRMVTEDAGRYQVNLNAGRSGGVSSPLTSAIQFYTQFAIPSSPLYSWSRTKQEDRTEFMAGDLATYFGHGSEAPVMERLNPNTNFDAAPLPQAADATINRTYGDFYGFAILRTAPNIDGAYAAAQTITSPQSAATLAEQLNMAPAHRSTIAAGTPGQIRQTIFNSALVARGWLSPDDSAVGQIFQRATDDVLAGRTSASGAASDLITRLRQQF